MRHNYDLNLYGTGNSCFNRLWTNGIIISQHTFKSNFYNITSFSNVEMMDELTMKYINWYNYVRPHSYNNYLTPMEARYR
ncbi:MAG: integrase core domain-containing protein [Pseudoruminococcus massiliensis]|uniref:integrase core domain-containing protein n=1 Tax=Pseudoruminococcus massiliensis TaxID=2086583 RepID=UPI003995556E